MSDEDDYPQSYGDELADRTLAERIVDGDEEYYHDTDMGRLAASKGAVAVLRFWAFYRSN